MTAGPPYGRKWKKIISNRNRFISRRITILSGNICRWWSFWGVSCHEKFENDASCGQWRFDKLQEILQKNVNCASLRLCENHDYFEKRTVFEKLQGWDTTEVRQKLSFRSKHHLVTHFVAYHIMFSLLTFHINHSQIATIARMHSLIRTHRSDFAIINHVREGTM